MTEAEDQVARRHMETVSMAAANRALAAINGILTNTPPIRGEHDYYNLLLQTMSVLTQAVCQHVIERYSSLHLSSDDLTQKGEAHVAAWCEMIRAFALGEDHVAAGERYVAKFAEIIEDPNLHIGQPAWRSGE